MSTIKTHVVNGFKYFIDAIQEADERHRGQIFIFGREDTGEFFTPPKIICTPSAFKTKRAAIIEADSYCYEVFLNGDLNSFLAIVELQTTNED